METVEAVERIIGCVFVLFGGASGFAFLVDYRLIAFELERCTKQFFFHVTPPNLTPSFELEKLQVKCAQNRTFGY